MIFYFNFGPRLNFKYTKIHIEAFPQSCRYGNYLSFATLGKASKKNTIESVIMIIAGGGGGPRVVITPP